MLKNIALVCGLLCIGLAVIVFVFADGLRRCYSGIFFVIIAAMMFLNALRWRHNVDQYFVL